MSTLKSVSVLVRDIITTRKQSLGQGNIFAPVCHSVHRGEYLGRYNPPPWAGTPPGRYTPRQVHPPGRYTPGQVHPPLQQVHPLSRYTLIPRQVHPPRHVHPTGRYTPHKKVHPTAMHAGIRSTSGRYASYWNAFLFCLQMTLKLCV